MLAFLSEVVPWSLASRTCFPSFRIAVQHIVTEMFKEYSVFAV